MADGDRPIYNRTERLAAKSAPKPKRSSSKSKSSKGTPAAGSPDGGADDGDDSGKD